MVGEVITLSMCPLVDLQCPALWQQGSVDLQAIQLTMWRLCAAAPPLPAWIENWLISLKGQSGNHPPQKLQLSVKVTVHLVRLPGSGLLLFLFCLLPQSNSIFSTLKVRHQLLYRGPTGTVGVHFGSVRHPSYSFLIDFTCHEGSFPHDTTSPFAPLGDMGCFHGPRSSEKLGQHFPPFFSTVSLANLCLVSHFLLLPHQ